MTPFRLLAVAAAALAFGSGIAHSASDEAWLLRAPRAAGIDPLLILVADTSAAMGEPIEARPPFDPARDYAGSVTTTPCRSDRVYWRRGPGPAPDCSSTARVSLAPVEPATGWRCDAGSASLASTGLFVAARAAQWEPRAGGGYWRALQEGDDGAVECRRDRGRHGGGTGPWFAANGASGPWHDDDTHEPAWDAAPLSDAYVFFTGNYLNYLASPERTTTNRYRWMTRLVSDAARSVAELDIALIRLSHDGLGGDDDGRGGMIVLPPASLPQGAAAVAAALESWTPAGPAPLAEALAETGLWLSGGPAAFGLDSHEAPGRPLPSAAGTRRPDAPERYLSPFTHACRTVTVGLLTAGATSADGGAPQALEDAGTSTATIGNCSAGCLGPVAGWLTRTDLQPAIPAAQRAALHVLADPTQGTDVLAAAASAGWPVIDLADPLSVAMLIVHALQHDAAVAAGERVSAAGLEAAGPGQHARTVHYALSAPRPVPRWPGNLRKFFVDPAGGPLESATVVGRDGEPAFDADGRLRTDSWSAWASAPDGDGVEAGGAAARLPAPASRRVYSDLTDATLTDPSNRFNAANELLTRERLGLGPKDPRTAPEIVEWLLGRDAFDGDLDGNRDEVHHAFGDPGLRAPIVLRHAPEGPGQAFVATQDGVLHALDADTGIERWAFAPEPMLRRLAGLSPDFPTAARTQGLDNRSTLHVRDTDGDGRIIGADGDYAWLYLGLGIGGTGYYALDVTDPDEPRLLWALHAADLPGFGQSWPVPVVARMSLDPSRPEQARWVVVLAGGYDPAEDARAVTAPGPGAALIVVDAASGEVLWRAAGPGDDAADLAHVRMGRGFPSAPRLVDLDGDGLAERAYALDIGGQLWRFDFPRPGDEAAGASARVLASLGGTEPATARRFYSTPDIVYERRNGAAQLAIAFGSGWLARPRDVGVADRFYVVFDTLTGVAGSAVGSSAEPLTETDLVDVTLPPYTAAPDARGWMVRLVAHGPGEKTAGSSLTFDHRLRFSTYQPLPPTAERPCGPPEAISRLYTLDIRTGRPVNWIGEEPVPADDTEAPGLPPDLRIAFPVAAGDCVAADCTTDPIALHGGRSLPLDFHNDPVKTSWRQLDALAE